MNLFNFFLCIISGIIAACPVLICKQFFKEHNFKYLRIIEFVLIITVLWTMLTLFYLYYIFKKINLGIFFPIIKLVEIFVPIILSILYFNENYNLYNYIGYLSAFIAIILISY